MSALNNNLQSISYGPYHINCMLSIMFNLQQKVMIGILRLNWKVYHQWKNHNRKKDASTTRSYLILGGLFSLKAANLTEDIWPPIFIRCELSASMDDFSAIIFISILNGSRLKIGKSNNDTSFQKNFNFSIEHLVILRGYLR